jgi:hypothetical protein
VGLAITRPGECASPPPAILSGYLYRTRHRVTLFGAVRKQAGERAPWGGFMPEVSGHGSSDVNLVEGRKNA